MLPAGGDIWVISSEDRNKYDTQFYQLQPFSGFLSGEQAKNFFVLCGLPPAILGQIWGLADVTADGRMDRKEFAVAMFLIKRRLQGYELPRALPRSLLADPAGPTSSAVPANNAARSDAAVPLASAAFGFAAAAPGFAAPPSSALPPSGVGFPVSQRSGLVHASPARVRSEPTGGEWAVSAAKRMAYMQLFNREDKMRSGYLSGYEAGRVLTETGLPNTILAQIWSLADVDVDGRLTAEEFCVAMHLAEAALAGQLLPTVLPPDLVPPSMRLRGAGASQLAGSDGAVQGGMMPLALGGAVAASVEELQPLSLEDKRRDNFVRGNQELERRRAELAAQQRREEEERLAKERAEAEKREQAKREQERKKQQELERQAERQRQMEAEREEQRRRAMEARETARRELERQRQRDWECQRKEQLVADRNRHKEAMTNLQAHVSKLKFELETLESKKGELAQRIAESKQAVVNGSHAIEAMRRERDVKLGDIDTCSRLQVDQEERFRKLCIDYEQFNSALQNQIEARPQSDAFKALHLNHNAKKVAVDSIRSQLEAQAEGSRELAMTMEAYNAELSELRSTISRLSSGITGKRSEAQRVREAWLAEKLRRRAEAERRASREDDERRAAAAAAASEKARREAAADAEKRKRDEEERKRLAAEEEERLRREEAAASRLKPVAAVATVSVSAAPFVSKDEKRSAFKDLAPPAELQTKQQTVNGWASFGADVVAVDNQASAWTMPNASAGSAAAPSSTSATSWPLFDASPFGDSSGSSVQLDKVSKVVASARSWGSAAAGQLSHPSSQPQSLGSTAKAASKSVGIRYRVLFDFSARNADELNLVSDDIILVNPEDQADAEPGWTRGTRGHDKGWFPSNYVELLEATAAATPAEVVVPKPAATNRTTAGAANQRAAFTSPANAVSSEPASSSASVFREVSSSSPVPEKGQPAVSGGGSSLKAVALYDWKAKKDNHLSFIKGDIITVKLQQDMWWSGELDSGAAEGWFPKSYVQPVPAAVNGGGSAANTVTTAQHEAKHRGTIVSTQTSSSTASGSMPASSSSVANDRGGSVRAAATALSAELEKTPSATAMPQQHEQLQESELAIAIYAYTSEEAGDLMFSLGDIITVTCKDGDWWTGTLGERSGMFPANYVKKMEGKSGAGKVQAAPTAAAVNAAAAAAASGGKKVEIGMVIAAYLATGPEQLSLQPNQLIQIRKKSESGWWEGELQVRGQKKKIGWFPKDYVKLLSSGSAGKNTPEPDAGLDSIGGVSSASNSPLPSAATSHVPGAAQSSSTATVVEVAELAAPEPPAPAEKVVASYPYQARQDDELSFNRGDIITVLDKEDVDWWRGNNGGRTGVFPANYVQPYTAAASAGEAAQEVHAGNAPRPTSSTPTALSRAVNWTNNSQLTETEKQRQRLITELMQTEESYVNDMVAVAEVFYEPLFENKLLSRSDLDAIFVNWKELIHSNRKLVKAMKVRSTTCGRGNPIIVVGDILVESLPTMTAYIRYCSQQLNAAALLQKRCENDAAVKDFLAKCAQTPRIRGLPLSSYLLKPMQRITRYPLLIEKIKGCTPSEHPDNSYISEALQKSEELASQVNEGVRQKDNSDKLEWIQNHVLCDGVTEKLTFNSLTNCLGPRKLIYSGALQKVRSGKDLYVFLFNDFLLLTQASSGSIADRVFSLDAKGIVLKMYKTPVLLNEVTVKPMPSDKQDSDTWVFHMTTHGDYALELKAVSVTERDAWIKRIKQCVEVYLDTEKKKRERAQSLIQHQLSNGIGRILVIVMEGCNLVPKDENGRSDPYCEVSMGCTMQKTKVMPSNLNPKWNSSMQFPVKSVQDDVLCLTVFDQDRFSPNDFLGRTEIRVADIIKDSKEKRGPVLKRLPLQEVASGEVVVKLDLQLFGGDKLAFAS